VVKKYKPVFDKREIVRTQAMPPERYLRGYYSADALRAIADELDPPRQKRSKGVKGRDPTFVLFAAHMHQQRTGCSDRAALMHVAPKYLRTLQRALNGQSLKDVVTKLR
jgi:hypothetical protein